MSRKLPTARRRLAYGCVALVALAASAAMTSASATSTGTGLPNASAAGHGRILWRPSTAVGASSFPSVQCAPGHFGGVKDPAKGRVWRADQAPRQERCEALGPALREGDTFFVGWSSKLDITDAGDRYVFQLKCSPSVGTANHPIELDATSGRIRLQEWDTRHVAHQLWSAPINNNQWHSYALRIHLSRNAGTIDFWFDGARQTFSTGSRTFVGTTYDGTGDYFKWGSYHPSPGGATNTFTSPTMATTLSAATSGS